MTTNVLGKYSFLDIPDVNGSNVLTLATGLTGATGSTNQIAVSGSPPSINIGLASNPVIPGNGSLTLPAGTTAQRPGSPTAGMTRFNSSLTTLEFHNGTTWAQIPNSLDTVYIHKWFGVINGTSGNTKIAWDNSAPLISEGTQLFSQTITPLSTNSKFEVMFIPNIDSSSNNRYVTLALFRNTTCICVSAANVTNASRLFTLALHFIDEPTTTSSITYSVRVGIGGGGGSWFINSSNAGARYNGLLANDWIIREMN